jgi:hypothetical protein
MSTDETDLISAADAQREFGINRATVGDWRTSGKLAPVRTTYDGQKPRYWYRREDIAALARPKEDSSHAQ